MPVPTVITDLSTTASSNSPAGGDSPVDGDDFLRALSAFIAQLRDKLNGTAATGTVKDATFSGTQAGAASWSGVQTFLAGLTSSTLSTHTAGVNLGNVARAAATTLDWYEEGTFTPVVQGSTSAGTGTYTNQVGRYTRIGNRVLINIDVRWSAHTGTGMPVVTSLPFTPANAYERLVGSYYQGTVDRPAIAYMATSAAKTGSVQTYVAGSDSFASVAVANADCVLNLSGSFSV